MSVLVKGMEIPKDCPCCKMAYYNASDEFTGCAVIPGKRYAMHNDAVYAKSTQRPDWCPLVEIPAHGRLIDADKMCADLVTVDPQYETMIEWCIQVTNAQPTIIEGSENHDD